MCVYVHFPYSLLTTSKAWSPGSDLGNISCPKLFCTWLRRPFPRHAIYEASCKCPMHPNQNLSKLTPLYSPKSLNPHTSFSPDSFYKRSRLPTVQPPLLKVCGDDAGRDEHAAGDTLTPKNAGSDTWKSTRDHMAWQASFWGKV